MEFARSRGLQLSEEEHKNRNCGAAVVAISQIMGLNWNSARTLTKSMSLGGTLSVCLCCCREEERSGEVHTIG